MNDIHPSRLMPMPSHRRLLFTLIRFLDGGIDTVLVEYLREIVRRGEYSVTLAIGVKMPGLEVFLGQLPAEVEVVYLNQARWLTTLPARRVKERIPVALKVVDELLCNPIRRFAFRRGLRRLAARHDVLVDFACSFASFMPSVRIPKIGFYHFSLPASLKTKTAKRARWERRFDGYDRIVTISRAMEYEFRETFPSLSGRLEMIYNAKDVETLMRQSEIPDGQIPQEPFLLSIERLEESQKDITTLLHVMRCLRDEYHISIPLYIIGKGKSEAGLKALAEELQLTDTVHFMGFILNPYPWLRQCTMLLHSAKFEGLPTVLIEALLLGKHVVSSDCPTGPSEILNGGKAGILVPPADERAMAEAVALLMSDEGKRRELDEGIRHHRLRFTFETTYGRFRKVVEGVATEQDSKILSSRRR